MGKKVIVSIVSEQAVQNLLFIKERPAADHYFFISTDKMEKEDRSVSACIINAAELDSDKCRVIHVVEDSLIDIENQLIKSVEVEDDDIFFVNITGGTKLMSIGVYNFFARLGSAEIFYLMVGKNECDMVFPIKKSSKTKIVFRVNLKQYLKVYGVSFKEISFNEKNQLLKPENETKELFKAFIGDEKSTCFKIAEKIRKKFRGKKLSEKDMIYSEVIRIKHYGFKPSSASEISKKETKYLTGDWFEEYVYSKIKNHLKLDDDYIGVGLNLVKGDNPNEYDVMFTTNNALTVIECKTDVSDKVDSDQEKISDEEKISYLFTNTLYKAATLKNEFGLRVNYYLFALNDFGKLNEDQLKRARQLDIKLVGLETLNDENKFNQLMSNM